MTARRLLDVLVGIYVSLLVVTASALVRWEAVAPEFSVGMAVVTGLGTAAVVTLLVGTVEDLAEKIAALPSVVIVMGQWLLYLAYLGFTLESGSMQALIAGAGAVAIAPGLASIEVAKKITIRRLQESTETTVVTVGEYDRWDRRHWPQIVYYQFNIGAVIVLTGGLVLSGFEGLMRSNFIFGFFMISSLVPFFQHRRDDWGELTLTDTGLWIGRWFESSFQCWDEFDGFRVTDDAITLVGPKEHQKRTFDREEISDETTLVEKLAAHLPRLDEGDSEAVDRDVESSQRRSQWSEWSQRSTQGRDYN